MPNTAATWSYEAWWNDDDDSQFVCFFLGFSSEVLATGGRKGTYDWTTTRGKLVTHSTSGAHSVKIEATTHRRTSNWGQTDGRNDKQQATRGAISNSPVGRAAVKVSMYDCCPLSGCPPFTWLPTQINPIDSIPMNGMGWNIEHCSHTIGWTNRALLDHEAVEGLLAVAIYI